MPASVPTLNLQDFRGGDIARQLQFVQQLGQALEDTGFFILEQPGLDPDVIPLAYGAAAEFFALPEPTKRDYADRGAEAGGFTPFGREHAKDSALPDLKEFWHVNRSSFAAGGLWPQEVAAFRPALTRLYQQLDACAAWLLEACALYLGHRRRWLSAMAAGGKTVLRVAHYPPVAADAPAGSLRAAPHEDINLITLLCAATEPGLEILSQGEWRPIQAQPGQLVVDTGDMLQNLTNGLFKSTTHRVVNPVSDSSQRLSMPFFVHPRPEVDLTPDPLCVERSGGAVQFPAMTAATYLNQRLQEIGLS